MTTGADLKEEAGGRRSYNVELVSTDLLGARSRSQEGRKQEKLLC